MIPLRLSLKNFLSYGEGVPTLSLEGIHIACLTGDNGAGKSALLDAMTWALWGRARGCEARGWSQDDLIHLGREEVEVELEFLAGPQRYRVRRQHRRAHPGHPGKTILDLQVLGEGIFCSISGSTIDETQEKISQKILHLDYRTFINSAFLLQGRADEFTLKNATERKELLADILGLSLYDELVERARAHRQGKEMERRELEAAIQNLERELARQPEYERERQGVEADLGSLQPRLHAEQAEVEALREKKQALEYKQRELREAEKNLEGARSECAHWDAQKKECHRRLAEYQEILGQRQTIEAGYQGLQQARQENDALNDKLSLLKGLTDRKMALERAILKARAQLETDLALESRQIQELEGRASQIAHLEQALAREKANLAGVEAEENTLEEKRQRARELHQELYRLDSANTLLKEEIASLKEKAGLLSQGDARCPLCETELGVGGRERLEAKYQAETGAKEAALLAGQNQMGEIQRSYLALEKEAGDMEARLNRERGSAQRQIAALESRLQEGQAAQKMLPQHREKSEVLGKQLGEFSTVEQVELAELERKEVTLGYGSARHEEVRRLKAGLEMFESLKRRLEEAERGIPQAETELATAEERASLWLKRVEEAKAQKEALARELVPLPEIARRLKDAELAYQASLARERQLRDSLARCRDRLERCQQWEREKAEKAGFREKSAREEDIFRKLELAFGKKGVQALLIEAALPEIEAEANGLLSRMTDNRMHLKIETQRERRGGKGEPLETLDIKIADEGNTRNYEMFSGGEAFRINFALRVALSKLLARRAGAPLQVLVIDEGFGTQDASGREKLVEAVNSVQDDFEKLLVITHIEELKELFPVRIEVTKTSQGSTIRVMD